MFVDAKYGSLDVSACFLDVASLETPVFVVCAESARA